MSQERLPMRKMREVLRLKAEGLSKRRIAASLGISATAVVECLQRVRLELAAPGRARRRGVGAAALLASNIAEGATAATGLAIRPSRAKAAGRDAAAAVGGVPRPASGRSCARRSWAAMPASKGLKGRASQPR
jgi:hypothetical protein